MELCRVRLSDPEVEPLLRGLADEYEARYGPNDEMSAATATEFTLPAGVFLVLVSDGETLSGGGIRRWSADTCEVKRMWTATHHRRRGHALVVLDGLERAARELGYTYIRAETGPCQPEAISLYERAGYRQICAYGPYEVARAFERGLLESRTGS